MAGAARGSPGLLPWIVTEEAMIKPAALPPAAVTRPPPQPALSVVDRTSAVIFVHQILMFDWSLVATKLAGALGEALALFPTLGCRATRDMVGLIR